MYWQFRERFSPGAFTREEKNTDFFTTFRITSLEEESTPLLFYTSEYLTSMDGLLLGDTRVRLNEFKAASTGEILLESDSFILTKINQSQYLFVFITSTEEMQRVNGMFDYTSKERELIKNQQWYNVTQLTL